MHYLFLQATPSFPLASFLTTPPEKRHTQRESDREIDRQTDSETYGGILSVLGGEVEWRVAIMDTGLVHVGVMQTQQLYARLVAAHRRVLQRTQTYTTRPQCR